MRSCGSAATTPGLHRRAGGDERGERGGIALDDGVGLLADDLGDRFPAGHQRVLRHLAEPRPVVAGGSEASVETSASTAIG